jgi:thiamine biosynthesis lipoprotein
MAVALAQPVIRRVEQIMGMPIVVDCRDSWADDVVLDRLFDWFRSVDQTFSTYKPESEVSRIAAGELAVEECSDDVRAVLAWCERLRDETDGYFDARAGGQLDPSGLVKGWSVERGARILADAELRNYAINAGGDVRLSGGAYPDPVWRVGIQHPHLRDRQAAVVECSDLAVATSGAYARGDHVIDPHTGRAPTGILSVTITGPDLALADAYATAAFAMGPDRAPQWTALLPRGYEALTILADDTVLRTGGFPSGPLTPGQLEAACQSDGSDVALQFGVAGPAPSEMLVSERGTVPSQRSCPSLQRPGKRAQSGSGLVSSRRSSDATPVIPAGPLA